METTNNTTTFEIGKTYGSNSHDGEIQGASTITKRTACFVYFTSDVFPEPVRRKVWTDSNGVETFSPYGHPTMWPCEAQFEVAAPAPRERKEFFASPEMQAMFPNS